MSDVRPTQSSKVGSIPIEGDGAGSTAVTGGEPTEEGSLSLCCRRVHRAAFFLFSNPDFFGLWVRETAKGLKRQIESERQIERLKGAWNRLKSAFEAALKQRQLERQGVGVPSRMSYAPLNDVEQAAEKRRYVSLSQGDARVIWLRARMHPSSTTVSADDRTDYRSHLAKWIRLQNTM